MKNPRLFEVGDFSLVINILIDNEVTRKPSIKYIFLIQLVAITEVVPSSGG